MGRFKRPTQNYQNQNSYGPREIGLIHPDLSTFVRLNDAGDIEIVVDDGLAIVLHRKSKSITFVADSIKILTKEGDSIRWNNSNLNSRATDFTQPALLPLTVSEAPALYDGSEEYFLED